MDSILDLDGGGSLLDVPGQWLQFTDENVLAGKCQITFVFI
jgi:hypothetical protein